jgi:excisionase family DNA binding protein
MENEYLTVQEVSKRLKVTRQAIYNWIADGRLKAVRVGGKAMRIPVSSLLEIMEPVKPGEPLEDESGQWEPALMAA